MNKMLVIVLGILCSFLFKAFAADEIDELPRAPKFSLENIKVDRIAGSLAYVSPSSIDSTVSFGADLPLGPIINKIHIGTTLDYWASSLGSLKYYDIVLGAYTRYVEKIFYENIPFDVYGGIGLDLHYFTYDYNTTLYGIIDDSDLEVGFSIFGGSIYKIDEKWSVFVEPRFRTNVEQFQFKIGGIYQFE